MSRPTASGARPATQDTDTLTETVFQIEEVAIKIAIEFCLAIRQSSFLFSEVLQFFREKGFEDIFITHMTAPIIGGEFLHEDVPADLLLKLIK